MASIGPELPPHLQTKPQSKQSPSSSPEPGASIPPVGPQIPAHVLVQSITPPQKQEEEEEDDDDDDDGYGPALPPNLAASRSGGGSTSVPAFATPKRVIGPAPPPGQNHDRYAKHEDEESDDDDIGPMPLPAGLSYAPEDGVRKFMEKEEKRRKEVEEAAKPKTLKRDEWMLVPPSSSDLLSSIDPTKLKARQFARSAAPAREQDTSLWTETPAERQQRIADEVSGKKRRAANAAPTVSPEEERAARKKRKLDEEIRRGVEEHTKKVRGDALVSSHSKAATPQDDTDKPPGVWDHARDMSLGGRLMDDRQRSKMLADAKGLGERFGAGKSGGFL